jgi:hypothetical protein
MRRRDSNLLLNWTLLAAAFTSFSTGLVLLVRFHMGDGAFSTSALGVGRLAWLNVHRLSGAFAAVAVAAHVALHWRTFRKILTSAATLERRRLVKSEPLMYGAFFISVWTGLVAWLVVKGSPPICGPVILAHASAARHAWIDAHHLSSLVSLPLVVHHVGHRWRSMARRPRRTSGSMAAPDLA